MTTIMAMLGPLEGFTVGITADRRAAEQAAMLLHRGARVVRGPVLRTTTPVADDEVRTATKQLLEQPPDYVIANTGVGVRAWLTAAQAWGWERELHAALVGSRILARGPKAAGALHAAGLEVWWRAPRESLAEVTARLRTEDLSGRRVAFQQHGDPETVLVDELRAAGADLVEIPVYRWGPPEDLRPAHGLVEALCRGDLDAVTFTSAPAIGALLARARERDREAQVRVQLGGQVVVAVVGPHCGAAARRVGVTSLVEPQPARLGSMVRALADRLAAGRVELRAPAAALTVQGRAVAIDPTDGPARTIWLPAREHHVLGRLLDRPGAVVSRADLRGDGVAADADHRLDVTVARLRRRLAAAGPLVQTVPKRGYRAAADLTA